MCLTRLPLSTPHKNRTGHQRTKIHIFQRAQEKEGKEEKWTQLKERKERNQLIIQPRGRLNRKRTNTHRRSTKRPVSQSHFKRFACFLSKFFISEKSAVGVLTESHKFSLRVSSGAEGAPPPKMTDRAHIKRHERKLKKA